jgi:hypothetical protein
MKSAANYLGFGHFIQNFTTLLVLTKKEEAAKR